MKYAIFKNVQHGARTGYELFNAEEYDTEQQARQVAESYFADNFPDMSDEAIEALDFGDYQLEIWSNEDCEQQEEDPDSYKFEGIEYFSVESGKPTYVKCLSVED